MPWKVAGNPTEVTAPSYDGEEWRFTIRLTTTGEKRTCITHLSASALASTPIPAAARSKGRPALMHFLEGAADDDPPSHVFVRPEGSISRDLP